MLLRANSRKFWVAPHIDFAQNYAGISWNKVLKEIYATKLAGFLRKVIFKC